MCWSIAGQWHIFKEYGDPKSRWLLPEVLACEQVAGATDLVRRICKQLHEPASMLLDPKGRKGFRTRAVVEHCWKSARHIFYNQTVKVTG